MAEEFDVIGGGTFQSAQRDRRRRSELRNYLEVRMAVRTVAAAARRYGTYARSVLENFAPQRDNRR
jgi:hypothetical protein